MKIFNILFLAISKAEFDFLEYRHSIDKRLFQEFPDDIEVIHLKLHEPGYTPKSYQDDQIFFQGRNCFFHMPLRLCRYIRAQQPRIVIIHSFKFPFQLFILKLFLSKKTKIIVQHHAEAPFKNRVKAWLQRIAYSNADAYFFSSRSLAYPFISSKVIPPSALITELPESTTFFQSKDRNTARDCLQLPRHKLLFLWVGRLNPNKDPMTVLQAFGHYIKDHPEAVLYMFYHKEDMLYEVETFINKNTLGAYIHMMGHHPQNELENWYNACDYFLSASHYESTGYALCEALACGCVPIVTNIPSYAVLTRRGECGILYEVGNAEELYVKLNTLQLADYEGLRQKAMQHFNNELSFAAISKKMMAIIRQLG